MFVPFCALIDCKNRGFVFLDSLFPQLLAHMLFAIVQQLFRTRVGRDLLEFPLPALYGDGAGGTIRKFVLLCALIAQTEGLRFWTPHSHSFLLMCSLQ